MGLRRCSLVASIIISVTSVLGDSLLNDLQTLKNSTQGKRNDYQNDGTVGSSILLIAFNPQELLQEVPNLPYSTDNNRISDGYSSTDAYDNVSPEFDTYTGSSSLPVDRHQFYLDYMSSAALQGIADFNAGDALEEKARVLLMEANYHHTLKPSKNFTVMAAKKWNPSGFAIKVGETYKIEVLREQFWTDGDIKVDGDGYESHYDYISECYAAKGRCRTSLRKKRRFATRWMSLVCGIGQYVRPLGAVQPGHEAATYWLPIDESAVIDTTFHVGRAITFQAQHSGELICFANDALTGYWDNTGNLTVDATRMSRPPSNDTYYESLYLPACDSANVVYANHGINVPHPLLKCNPYGGGSGWTEAQISNQTMNSNASGAPANLTMSN